MKLGLVRRARAVGLGLVMGLAGHALLGGSAKAQPDAGTAAGSSAPDVAEAAVDAGAASASASDAGASVGAADGGAAEAAAAAGNGAAEPPAEGAPAAAEGEAESLATETAPAPDPVAQADALFAAGRYVEAAQAYGALAQRSPEDAHLHAMHGASLLNAGQPGQAVVALRIAVQLNASNADYFSTLGDAWHAYHRLVEARKAYIMAIRIQPNHARARAGLAKVVQDEAAIEMASTPEVLPKLRDFGLVISVAKELGFGGGLRVRFNHLALEATAGASPYFLAIAGSCNDTVFGAAGHYAGSLLFFFNDEERSMQNGLRLAGFHNTLFGPGGSLGWQGEIGLGNRFGLQLGAGVQIHPEGEERAEAEFVELCDLSDSRFGETADEAIKDAITPLLTTVQVYVGLSLVVYVF